MKINKFIAKFSLVFLVLSVLPVRVVLILPTPDINSEKSLPAASPISISVSQASAGAQLQTQIRVSDCQFVIEDNNWLPQGQSNINLNQPADCFTKIAVAETQSEALTIVFKNLATPEVRVASSPSTGFSKPASVVPGVPSKDFSIGVANWVEAFKKVRTSLVSSSKTNTAFNFLKNENTEAFEILRC